MGPLVSEELDLFLSGLVYLASGMILVGTSGSGMILTDSTSVSDEEEEEDEEDELLLLLFLLNSSSSLMRSCILSLSVSRRDGLLSGSGVVAISAGVVLLLLLFEVVVTVLLLSEIILTSGSWSTLGATLDGTELPLDFLLPLRMNTGWLIDTLNSPSEVEVEDEEVLVVEGFRAVITVISGSPAKVELDDELEDELELDGRLSFTMTICLGMGSSLTMGSSIEEREGALIREGGRLITGLFLSSSELLEDELLEEGFLSLGSKRTFLGGSSCSKLISSDGDPQSLNTLPSFTFSFFPPSSSELEDEELEELEDEEEDALLLNDFELILMGGLLWLQEGGSSSSDSLEEIRLELNFRGLIFKGSLTAPSESVDDDEEEEEEFCLLLHGLTLIFL